MSSNTMVTILPLILLLVIMYFLLIRPQKKKEKEIAAMRDGIKVGDEIVTIGGICAKVVKTKEESLIIQVGADKVKFEVMRWSVSKIVSSSSAASEEQPVEEKKPVKPKKLVAKAAEPEAEEAPAEDVVTEESKPEELEKVAE